MINVTAGIKKELYKVELKSASGNTLIADEPIANGGKDAGFSPKELLISALAACTSATIRMYADHKGWEVDEIKVDIELDRDEKENKTSVSRKITLYGKLDEAQRARIVAIANNCPLHKILSNPIEINTFLD